MSSLIKKINHDFDTFAQHKNSFPLRYDAIICKISGVEKHDILEKQSIKIKCAKGYDVNISKTTTIQYNTTTYYNILISINTINSIFIM